MYQIIRCLWFHRSHRHHHHRDRVIDISFLLIALKVLWDCCQLLWNIQLFLLFDGSVVLNPRFATRPVYHYHQRGVTLSYKRVSWFPQKTQYKVRLKQPFLVVSSGFSPGVSPKGERRLSPEHRRKKRCHSPSGLPQFWPPVSAPYNPVSTWVRDKYLPQTQLRIGLLVSSCLYLIHRRPS
jgi:hypothetical protein